MRIRATETTTLDVASERAPVQLEAITVQADESMVERSTQQVNSTVDGQALTILPIPRTAVELVQFTPGARADQVWGGSTEQANVYQLDGVNVNDPGFGGDFLLPNVDWIEEISVKGLGAGAEYGGFQGGVVNIVTKSGTNTFEPNLRFNYGASSLNASNVNAFEAGSEVDSRWEINGDVAGPIVRDKLYYFLSGQYVRTNTRVVDFKTSTEEDVDYLTDPSGSTLFEERSEAKFLGKLTYKPTFEDAFDLSIGYDGLFTDNAGLNSFDDPATALKQESPAVFGNASWQRMWSARHHTELKVTGYNAGNDLLPLNGPNTTNVRLLGGNRESFRNNEYTRLRSPDNVAVTLNWDSYWYTGKLLHNLKIGGEYKIGWWKEGRTRNANLAWRPDTSGSGTTFNPDDPSTWTSASGGFISSDWGGDINLDARSTNASIYVQDYIDITPRVSISPGLRLSYFRGDLTPGDGSGSRFKATDDVQIAPRLGASVSLLPERNLTLKGHWGRYYQDMFALMFDRTEGGNVFTNVEYWDWADASDPELDRAYTESERDQLFVFFGEETLGDEVGPVENWKQPYVDQLVAGLEFEFARNWKASVFYVNRRNKSIISLVDKNQATNYTSMSNIEVFDFETGDPVLDQNGQPLVLDGILVSNDDILYVDEEFGLTPEELGALGLTPGEVANLSYDQDFALTVADEASRKMDQVQVSVERAFRNWSLLASVVWTDLRGNFFSVSGYDDAFGIGTGPFVRPNERIKYDGKLQNHSEWEFKLRANAVLPANFRVGAFATFFSGD
ncbi:MAG: TonB-dependent receptor, partial [Gemmatimonadota bacterium]